MPQFSHGLSKIQEKELTQQFTPLIKKVLQTLEENAEHHLPKASAQKLKSTNES